MRCQVWHTFSCRWKTSLPDITYQSLFLSLFSFLFDSFFFFLALPSGPSCRSRSSVAIRHWPFSKRIKFQSSSSSSRLPSIKASQVRPQDEKKKHTPPMYHVGRLEPKFFSNVWEQNLFHERLAHSHRKNYPAAAPATATATLYSPLSPVSLYFAH